MLYTLYIERELSNAPSRSNPLIFATVERASLHFLTVAESYRGFSWCIWESFFIWCWCRARAHTPSLFWSVHLSSAGVKYSNNWNPSLHNPAWEVHPNTIVYFGEKMTWTEALGIAAFSWERKFSPCKSWWSKKGKTATVEIASEFLLRFSTMVYEHIAGNIAAAVVGINSRGSANRSCRSITLNFHFNFNIRVGFGGRGCRRWVLGSSGWSMLRERKNCNESCREWRDT